MDSPSLYEDDILEWSEQQAAALRRLAQNRRDLSNELDWQHVAEEIESVGRSELATVQGLTRKILIQLIKAISIPESQLLLNLRREAVAFHNDIADHLSPSMLARIDMDKLWQQASKQADAVLAVHGRRVTESLPKRCPLRLDDILAPDFDFIATVEALRLRLESDRASG